MCPRIWRIWSNLGRLEICLHTTPEKRLFYHHVFHKSLQATCSISIPDTKNCWEIPFFNHIDPQQHIQYQGHKQTFVFKFAWLTFTCACHSEGEMLLDSLAILVDCGNGESTLWSLSSMQQIFKKWLPAAQNPQDPCYKNQSVNAVEGNNCYLFCASHEIN
jgi:hypothetical protein